MLALSILNVLIRIVQIIGFGAMIYIGASFIANELGGKNNEE